MIIDIKKIDKDFEHKDQIDIAAESLARILIQQVFYGRNSQIEKNIENQNEKSN